MVTYAVITLINPISVKASSTSPDPAQDEIAAPPSKAAMDELMKQKLAAAQGALEAVTREDYEQLRKVSLQMIALSHKEVWEQMASPRFVQDTADFVAAVEFMDRMATAGDTEGVTLGFARLTMACAECHRHMRTPTVAQLKLQPELPRQNLLARLRPDL
jgi:hypothetical protein